MCTPEHICLYEDNAVAWCLELSLGALHPAETKEELSVTLYTQDSPNNLGYTPTEPKMRSLILGRELAPDS